MSNPENAAAQSSSESSSETLTFADQVNSIVNQAATDEKGNLVLPEDVKASEEVLYAAKLEKRRRDTQSALGKSTQELAAERKMREELEKRVAAQVKIDMTPEESERLENLKFDDPEAWRKEMNKLEQKATTTVQEELSSLSTEASQYAEKERRVQILEDFNSKAKVPITDEVLENDIPPRLVKKLESGEVTFEEFLAQAEDYLTSPKKVAGTKIEAQPNLNSAGGAAAPSEAARAMQSADDYKNTIF